MPNIYDTLTVADELAFDALPEATRALCDKIIAHRVSETHGYDETDLELAEEKGYRRGLAEGKRLAGTPADPALPLDGAAFAAKPKDQDVA